MKFHEKFKETAFKTQIPTVQRDGCAGKMFAVQS